MLYLGHDFGEEDAIGAWGAVSGESSSCNAAIEAFGIDAGALCCILDRDHGFRSFEPLKGLWDWLEVAGLRGW